MSRDVDMTPDSELSFDDDYARSPHHLKADKPNESWCYIEEDGIHVVFDVKGLGVTTVLVPSRLLDSWHRRRSSR